MDKATHNMLAKIDAIPVTLVTKEGKELRMELGDFGPEPKTKLIKQRTYTLGFWFFSVKVTFNY